MHRPASARRTVGGFTLIELLVVSALIAMLTSVVMTSIASARAKAADNAIKANLNSIINQAELYRQANGTYGTTLTAAVCPTSGTTMFFADQNINQAIAAALAASQTGTTRCATDGNNWAVSVRLRSTTDHYCVDSLNRKVQTANASWTGVTCP